MFVARAQREFATYLYRQNNLSARLQSSGGWFLLG